MDFQALEKFQKEFRKKIKKEGRAVRFNSKSSVTFTEGSIKLSTTFYESGYNVANTNGAKNIYCYSYQGQPTKELIGDAAEYWTKFCELEERKKLFLSSDSPYLADYDFIKLSNGWFKQLDGKEENGLREIKNLNQTLYQFKEKDPTYTYSIGVSPNDLDKKEAIDVLSIDFYVLGENYRLFQEKKKTGERELQNQTTKEAIVFKTEKERTETIEKWIEDAFTRHRLDVIFEPPKRYFTKLMYSLGTDRATEKMYNLFRKHYSQEEIEEKSIQMLESSIEKYQTKAKSCNITLLNLFDKWYLVYENEIEEYEKEDIEEAIEKFKAVTLEKTIGKKLNKQFAQLKTAAL
jgi:hypothetical protein